MIRSHFFTLNLMVPHCRRIHNLCLFQGLTVKKLHNRLCNVNIFSTVLESNAKTHDDFSIIKVLFKSTCFFIYFFYFAILEYPVIFVMHDFLRKQLIFFPCNKIWNVFCTFLSIFIHVSGLKPNSLAFFFSYIYICATASRMKQTAKTFLFSD